MSTKRNKVTLLSFAIDNNFEYLDEAAKKVEEKRLADEKAKGKYL
jgi:hypothetical protein